MNEISPGIKIVSSFTLYKSKLEYVSKDTSRICLYNTLFNYIYKAITFYFTNIDLMHNDSMKEIIEKILNIENNENECTNSICIQYNNCNPELRKILKNITIIFVNNIKKEFIYYIDNQNNENITNYFVCLAAFSSMIYESLNIDNNTVTMFEDIRFDKLKYIEKEILEYLLKNNYSINVKIVGSFINEYVFSHNENINFEFVNYEKYNEYVSIINNGTKLL